MSKKVRHVNNKNHTHKAASVLFLRATAGSIKRVIERLKLKRGLMFKKKEKKKEKRKESYET